MAAGRDAVRAGGVQDGHAYVQSPARGGDPTRRDDATAAVVALDDGTSEAGDALAAVGVDDRPGVARPDDAVVVEKPHGPVDHLNRPRREFDGRLSVAGGGSECRLEVVGDARRSSRGRPVLDDRPGRRRESADGEDGYPQEKCDADDGRLCAVVTRRRNGGVGAHTNPVPVKTT